MRLITTVFIGSFLLFESCSVEPEPIVYGTDLCHACRMTLMDNKFGAELVTKKGKIYKFDDMRCLLDYYSSELEPKDAYQHIMVIDYANGGKLIDATKAFYLSSPEIRSPMDGQIAAVNSQEALENLRRQWSGTRLTWEEISSKEK